MFEIAQTFTDENGFHLTPIAMQDVGPIFLPKELEDQLEYNDLSKTILHSESFSEGIEYIVLRDSNLKSLKELLNRGNSITSVGQYHELLKHSSALVVLTESGLSSLLALSRKPNIQSFRQWVSVQILPLITTSGKNMLEKFNLTKTFTNDGGFTVTPIEMQGVGFIFLPKELEEQLGYDNFSNTIRQNESFTEGIEYLILKDSNLLELKELLNRRNTIASVSQPVADEFLKHSSALIVLTESGLYTSIILSRKPNAQIFRRWITGEVLPSIRRTGMFYLANRGEASALAVPTVIAAQLQEMVRQQQAMHHTIQQFVHESLQFHNYVLRGFERVDAVLAESLPHDMFSGWKKIKGLVDEMTQIYGLSDVERKRYLRELCQVHDVLLPEKALVDSESPYYDAEELAVKIGIYSVNDRPHSRLVVALIRHLGLDRDQYCHKFPVMRSGYTAMITKYSDNVVAHILEWLRDRNYPSPIKLTCGARGKIRKFQVRYHAR